MPKSNYEIAKQIISESQKSVFIFKSQFEKLNSIFSLSSVPDSDFWENIFKCWNELYLMIIKEVIEHGLNNIRSFTLSLELYYNKYTIYMKKLYLIKIL